MAERYRIDVEEPGLLDARSARWLRIRILGLLNVKSRLRAEVFPQEKPGGDES